VCDASGTCGATPPNQTSRAAGCGVTRGETGTGSWAPLLLLALGCLARRRATQNS
jgi:hypothetical protein